jgi:hypothetical protein
MFLMAVIPVVKEVAAYTPPAPVFSFNAATVGFVIIIDYCEPESIFPFPIYPL